MKTARQDTSAVRQLDAEQLRIARGAFREGGNPYHVATVLGLADEDELLEAVSVALQMDRIDLTETKIDTTLLASFPARLIHRRRMFPINRSRDGLVVAVADPFDLDALDTASNVSGERIHPTLAHPRSVAALIKRYLGVGAETIDGMLADSEEDGTRSTDQGEFDESEVAEMAQQASVVRLVNEILNEAVEACASDIHLESTELGMQIRYRIDGVLQHQPVPPEIHRFRAAIISRLKIMAQLNIAERRLPQDGRLKIAISGRGSRCARFDHSHASRRGSCDARAGQREHELLAARSGDGPTDVRAVSAA